MESSKALSLWYNLSNETSLAELCSGTLYFHFSAFYKRKKCRSLFFENCFPVMLLLFCPIQCLQTKYMLQIIFYHFSLVSTSLAYITIPKNKRKRKITRLKKKLQRVNICCSEINIPHCLNVVSVRAAINLLENCTPVSSPTKIKCGGVS